MFVYFCDGPAQFKLRGTPWALQDYSLRYSNTTLACALLRTIDEHGYTLISSGDISSKYVNPDNGSSYSIDVDSWFIVRKPALGATTTPAAAAAAAAMPTPLHAGSPVPPNLLLPDAAAAPAAVPVATPVALEVPVAQTQAAFITVPEGCAPGSMLQVVAPSGQVVQVQVPAGVQPGQQLQAMLPV